MIVLLAGADAAVVFGQIAYRRIITFISRGNLESVGAGDLALRPVTASHEHKDEGEQSERAEDRERVFHSGLFHGLRS